MKVADMKVFRIVLKADISSTELFFFNGEGKEVYGKYPRNLRKFFFGSNSNDQAVHYIRENFPDVQVETNLKKPECPTSLPEVTKARLEYCEGQYTILAFVGDKLYSRSGFYAHDYLKADILEWVKTRYPNAQVLQKSVDRVKLWGKSSFFDHA